MGQGDECRLPDAQGTGGDDVGTAAASRQSGCHTRCTRRGRERAERSAAPGGGTGACAVVMNRPRPCHACVLLRILLRQPAAAHAGWRMPIVLGFTAVRLAQMISHRSKTCLSRRAPLLCVALRWVGSRVRHARLLLRPYSHLAVSCCLNRGRREPRIVRAQNWAKRNTKEHTKGAPAAEARM